MPKKHLTQNPIRSLIRQKISPYFEKRNSTFDSAINLAQMLKYEFFRIGIKPNCAKRSHKLLVYFCRRARFRNEKVYFDIQL
jgi:hypothetical protein